MDQIHSNLPPADELVARLQSRVEMLAAISEPGEGITRLAFTELEREAHRLVETWAVEAGATASADDAGNSVFVFRAGEPYLLVGSHIDSVSDGGRYDGIVGVLAALEAAGAIHAQIQQGVRVVVFSAEEGARFGPPCLGSSIASGQMTADDLAGLFDREGVSALDAARSVGLDPAACAPWATGPSVSAFLEVHIEQGMVLESEKVRLGVVDVIAGAARLNVTITGRPEHSGATPMRIRADALAAASELVLAVEAIGQRERGGTATVGRLTVEPNGVTTIPGRVLAGVDIRNADKGRQESAVEAFKAAAAEIATNRGVECSIESVGSRDPVMLSAWARQALGTACVERKLPYRLMPSGAGHDAAILAVGAPAGMLFVASPNGMSHVPHEACRLSDVSLACGVLCDALVALDAQSRAG